MSQSVESEFLVADGRLGSWWVPDYADLNSDGNLDSLPERREAGIVTAGDDGEWSLLLVSEPPAADDRRSRNESLDSMRRELMWGKAQGSAVSLFDATLTGDITDSEAYSHEVWRGSWHVDSPSRWFRATDRVESIHIAFAAALAWSDLPPGQGRKHNMHRQWDRESRVFTSPETVVHEAKLDDATVRLLVGVASHHSEARTEFNLDSRFLVADDIEIGEVLGKWVEPLHDLVGLFWLGNPGIVSVEAKRSDDRGLSRIRYSGRFAPADPSEVLNSAHRFAPFSTVEGLTACGYGFDDLLTGYWLCRERGYARAIQRLHESQDSHLDTSIDARMLSAVKSLESLEKARTGQTGTIELSNAAENLLNTTGVIGDEVRDIWSNRGPQKFKNSIARYRGEILAHEQSGQSLRSRTEDELADQHWHHIALQWLLRRRLLEAMGIAAADADHLVADSLAYKDVFRHMRDHYDSS